MKTKIVITSVDDESTVNDKNFKFRHTTITRLEGQPVLVHLQTNNLTVAKTLAKQLDGEDFMDGEPINLSETVSIEKLTGKPDKRGRPPKKKRSGGD